MSLLGIFIGAFIVGFSGAMMPGPMLSVTINSSIRKGYLAGPLIVLGHGILELTLIIAMVLGLKDFFSNPVVSGFIGIFGGCFLAWMGFGMIKSGIKKTVSLKNQEDAANRGKSLILTGIVVSITNPYFVIWWASTGMELVRQSYVFGIAGILVFFAGHILSDFLWYSAVSTAFYKGKKLISDKAYSYIIIGLGLFVSGFSIYFIASGWQMLYKM